MWECAWREIEDNWDWYIGNDIGGVLRVKVEEEYKFANTDELRQELVKLIEHAIEGKTSWGVNELWAYPWYLAAQRAELKVFR
jgi:hypothetical protein